MKFDRQLRPATGTSWVVSYGGKTITRWRTASILKIDISPYLGEKSSDFHETLYTAADFELDERHVIKNEKKICIGQTPSSTERISCLFFCNFWQLLEDFNVAFCHVRFNEKIKDDERRVMSHNQLGQRLVRWYDLT